MKIPVDLQIKKILKNTNRIIIKLGTRVIDDPKVHFNKPVVEGIVKQIAELKNSGKEIVLVTSGAVGAGIRAMELKKRPDSVTERQALAAIGQSRLMFLYKELFREKGIKVAQLLLTRTDFEDRERYLNVRTTMETILKWGIIPIVNENDTVAIEELTFGDNDMLSALIAGKLDADVLLLLTDVKGLYNKPPKKGNKAKLLKVVDKITSEIESLAGGTGSEISLGGMKSKVVAAKTATSSGVLVGLGMGKKKGIIEDFLDGKPAGTWFLPNSRRLSARKKWIVFGKRASGGGVEIDPGAVKAIQKDNKSLLPSGVTRVFGEFNEKDLIIIEDKNGKEIARGLVNYNAETLRSIIGMKTGEIKKHFPGRKEYEIINRDDLVLTI